MENRDESGEIRIIEIIGGIEIIGRGEGIRMKRDFRGDIYKAGILIVESPL